jgi:hypothetical protein
MRRTRRFRPATSSIPNPAYHFKRIGLEAGPLSQWLYSALAEAGLPVICVETRHMRAVLKAQINKTDRNDARGMAQMMRVGLYRPVHVKTLSPEPLDPSIREGGRLVLVKNLFGVLCDLCTKIEFVDWRSRHLP